MKQKILLACLALGLLYSCKKNTIDADADQDPVVLLSKAKIDEAIRAGVEENGSFNWNDQTSSMIWSALEHSDNIMSVGYKPEGITGDVGGLLHAIDINSDE